MDLKELVGEELAGKISASQDELVKQIVAKLGEKKLVLDDGKLVPQYRIKELSDQIVEKDKLLKKNEDDLKAIKAETENIPTLKAKITEIQAMNKQEREQFEAEQLKTKKSTALVMALVGEKVYDPLAQETLIKTVDLNKVELDETGKLKDPVSFLKPYKESSAFKGFFGTVRMEGQDHQEGVIPTPLDLLQTQLATAQKTGRMAEVIAIRRQIFDQQQPK